MGIFAAQGVSRFCCSVDVIGQDQNKTSWEAVLEMTVKTETSLSGDLPWKDSIRVGRAFAASD
jgi:hypothetical protein